MSDPSHVLRDQPVELKEDLNYEERPVQIVDRKDQVLRNKVIPLVKVLWMNHGKEKATWEREDQMQCNAPKIPYNVYNNFIIYSGYELSQTWVFPGNLIN